MMESNRRRQAVEELGLEDRKEQASINRSLLKETERKEAKLAKKLNLEDIADYKLLRNIARIMDTYYLDPIIGLFPVVGDTITAAFALPFIYVSASKIKSFSLTLAIIYNVMLDAFVGMIPFYIGNVLDIFIKSHKKNFKLIVGFVEDDKDIIREVNRKAVKSAIGILIFIGLIYLLITLIANTITWIIDLF